MPAPNLTPLLDVLFVLLLFCMLGADFGPRECEPLRLPKATSVGLCWSTSRRLADPLRINVHHRDDRTCAPHLLGRRCKEEGHWMMSVHGIECTDPEVLKGVLVRAATSRHDPWEPITSRRIILRADRNAPYGLARQAVDVCALMGFDRLILEASSRRQ